MSNSGDEPEKKPDLAERVGKTINELDIDFSRFTAAGWLVSAGSLGLGVLAGWLASSAVPAKFVAQGGSAVAFGFATIGTAVVVFIGLHAALAACGVSVVKQ